MDSSGVRDGSDRFLKMAQHIPGMLYQFHVAPDGRMSFPFTTAGIELIYGVSPEQVRDDAAVVLERIHPDDTARVMASIERSRVSLSPWRCRYRVNHPDGRQIWVEGDAGPEPLADGGILWHGYIRDITASVQLEEQIQRERERLTHIAWGAAVGTWEWNMQTGETRFDERWAEMLGYGLVELEPVSIETWLKLAHPEDNARVERELQRHFSGEIDHCEQEVRMRHRLGHWVWVLGRGRLVSRTADGVPEWLVGIHIDITERKRLEARLSQMANHDTLTGLPRRALLVDRLAQAMAHVERRHSRLAVALIDLDGFRHVNEAHGEPAGDHLLVDLSRRMTSLLRAGDTVARLGGDEFVMVLTDLQPDDDGSRHLARILDALSGPAVFEGKPIAVTASIGVAHYPAEIDVDPDELLRRADKAAYRAKGLGRNRVAWASP